MNTIQISPANERETELSGSHLDASWLDKREPT